MKIILAFLIITCLLISCVSTKKVMDSWIGSTKQNLVLQLGPPTRNVSDENGGDIVVNKIHLSLCLINNNKNFVK